MRDVEVDKDGNPPMRDVSLVELVRAMADIPDEAVFRYYQTSWVASDGSIHPGETLRLTVGRLRAAIFGVVEERRT